MADNTPCFITEDEVGNLQLTTVNELARAFRGRWPRVTFLSGCHTGQVPNQGTVPSMAQALVKAGAGIVLGWARPVFDRTGIIAAQALYQALATGATVEEAVKAAQQEMIDQECTDWHLLRMYRDTRPINQLVTPLRGSKIREKLKLTAPEQEFLDENNQVKVASRFEFVGRRRPLQRCLKALRETSDQIGVFIAGMGGLGKSSLLTVHQDYRILGTIGRAEEVLGFVQEAVVHFQQALDICPEDDLTRKATTINNMALIIAQQGDIARAIILLAQSLQIQEQIGDVKGKAAILNNMAGAIAQRGGISKAIALYEQSLEICEQIGDLKGKAATLNNMAQVIAQQGDIPKAIRLWKQSLEIKEAIGDVKGKATTLNNMAGVIAQQGDIARAIALWEQDLEISEQIGDVKGKALTLANIAYWTGETGDKVRELELNLQAALALTQVCAYVDLVTVLTSLGVTDESNGLVYLAQAIWLTLRIRVSLAQTIQLIHALYDAVPQGDELEALLGATAMFFCNRRGEGHPQLEELQDRSSKMISGAADAQGIETQEAFDTWIVQQRLNDLKYFLPRLNQRLKEIVGDGWLFDRSQFEVEG